MDSILPSKDQIFFMYSLSELILFGALLLYSTITYFMSTMLLDSVILATYQWTKRQTYTALWEHLSAEKICNKITSIQIPSNAIISAMRQSKNNLKHEVTNIGNSCRGSKSRVLRGHKLDLKSTQVVIWEVLKEVRRVVQVNI